MNIEEIDKWLDNEYGCSYTRLEELHDFLIERNMKFQDELDKYKNIVDELEKYIEKHFVGTIATNILNKLKELKGE